MIFCYKDTYYQLLKLCSLSEITKTLRLKLMYLKILQVRTIFRPFNSKIYKPRCHCHIYFEKSESAQKCLAQSVQKIGSTEVYISAPKKKEDHKTNFKQPGAKTPPKFQPAMETPPKFQSAIETPQKIIHHHCSVQPIVCPNVSVLNCGCVVRFLTTAPFVPLNDLRFQDSCSSCPLTPAVQEAGRSNDVGHLNPVISTPASPPFKGACQDNKEFPWSGSCLGTQHSSAIVPYEGSCVPQSGTCSLNQQPSMNVPYKGNHPDNFKFFDVPQSRMFSENQQPSTINPYNSMMLENQGFSSNVSHRGTYAENQSFPYDANYSNAYSENQTFSQNVSHSGAYPEKLGFSPFNPDAAPFNPDWNNNSKTPSNSQQFNNLSTDYTDEQN